MQLFSIEFNFEKKRIINRIDRQVSIIASAMCKESRNTFFFNALINRVFYEAKPLIPRQLQLALRREIARYKRKKYSHVWPIDPCAGKKPSGWRGWPEGKRFALVLSHDVDTAKGQDCVLKLAELELDLGFRSAFNFVPERYINHKEIKSSLINSGFELNVHGLKHDGKLFSSNRVFENEAIKINKYLKNWGSTGFTSPSMLSRADWLHKLDITHSISSFDTDPFEPQPYPVRTIFPFWVGNGNSSRGYVELPYTLPQDHLLFVILKEKTIDIWKQKLDWVVSCGGMALLTTHSDYMNFGNRPLKEEEYPVQFYESFLNYVNKRYKDKFYHALPRDIAGCCFPTLLHMR